MSSPSHTTPTLRYLGKQERIERILLAARELIEDNPERTFTIALIAERARVAPMTVTNLVGNRDDIWAALADQSLSQLDFVDYSDVGGDPRERARRMIRTMSGVIVDNAVVFKALVVGWSESGKILEREPTADLIECLRDAATTGQIDPTADFRRVADAIFAGFLGTVHQWAAGLFDDDSLHVRTLDLVDICFAAASLGIPARQAQHGNPRGRTTRRAKHDD